MFSKRPIDQRAPVRPLREAPGREGRAGDGHHLHPMQDPERGIDLSMMLQIAYPSGMNFKIEGVWKGLIKPNGIPSLAVDLGEQEDNPVMLLDPRAIVRNSEGKRIYRPSRRSLEGSPELQAWLVDNPGWVR